MQSELSQGAQAIHGAAIRRVGFVSTRIAGTDGVSLEIAKWEAVIHELGVECFYITGESDRPAERTALIEEAHFTHPTVLEISQRAFGTETRTAGLTREILDLSLTLKDKIHQAVEAFDLDAIIAENALTIPMNIPLGVALVMSLQEMGIACVAHHHDFYWERERFLIGAVDDFLRFAFPPALPHVQHVVINSIAAEEFSRRTGLSCRIIPNVMDFSKPPKPPDDYAREFRREIGLQEHDILILQPTRVIQRKGIEHAIELCHKLDKDRAKLVITHQAGDERLAYQARIRDFADLLGVELLFVAGRIGETRGIDHQGRKRFTLSDAFSQADLVAYPSEYEGFGNAFLEAIYNRCPVVCNRHSIYRTDIEPFGFRSILFDGFLTEAAIDDARKVLCDAALREEIVAHNYEAGARFFGYDVLRDEFLMMLRRPHNVYRLRARSHRFQRL